MARFNGAAHSRARKFSEDMADFEVRFKLQWGRALSCAEIPGMSRPHRRRQRFNGAAHSRARKFVATSINATQLPGFNGAAHSRARKLVLMASSARMNCASMGPLTLVRGNISSGSLPAGLTLLQWGRALSCA